MATHNNPPGTGNRLAKSLTYFFNDKIYESHLPVFNVYLKSFNFVDFVYLLAFDAISVPLFKNDIIWTKSFYWHPLVVIPGLPILIPEGTNALLSPGTVFLLI